MTDFAIEVRTMIPAPQYKQLHQIATAHHTTVGALVAEIARRATAPAPMRTSGRPSKYTAEAGERILDARRFHRSYSEIAAEEHIAIQTAQRWFLRAQAEARTAHIETEGIN